MKIAKLIGMLLLAGFYSASANAGFITGQIFYGGTFDSGGDLTSLTALDLTPNTGAAVTFANGDLAGTTTVDIQDFTFSPFAGPQEIWQGTNGGGTTFKFILNTLQVTLQDNDDLDMKGKGVIQYVSGPGTWSTTQALWAFSAQSSLPGGSIFGFSADSAAIPEPSILSILGLGLLGIGLSSRKRRVKT